MSKRKTVNSNSRAQSSANDPQQDQARMSVSNPQLRASTKAQTELSKALSTTAASARKGKQIADDTGGDPNSNQVNTRSGAKSKHQAEQEKMPSGRRGGRQKSVSKEGGGRRTHLKSGGDQQRARVEVEDEDDNESEEESDNEQEYQPDAKKNRSAVSHKRRGGGRGSRANSSNSLVGIAKHAADQKKLTRAQGNQAKSNAQNDFEEKKRSSVTSAHTSKHQDRTSDVEEIEDQQQQMRYDPQVDDDELDQLEEEERFLKNFNKGQASRSPQATPSFTSHLPSTQKQNDPSLPFNGVELIDLVSPYKPSQPADKVPDESKQSSKFQRLLTQGSKKPHPLHDSYRDTSLSQSQLKAHKQSSVLPPGSGRSSNSSKKRKYDEISNGDPEGISLDDNIVGSNQTPPTSTPAKIKDVDMTDVSQPGNEQQPLQESKRKKMNQEAGSKSRKEESKDGEESYIDLQNQSGVKGRNNNGKSFDSTQADRLFNKDRQQSQIPPASQADNFEFTVEPFDDDKMEGVASFSQNQQANKQKNGQQIANPFVITREQHNSQNNNINNNNFSNLKDSQDGSLRSPSFSQSGLISSNKKNEKSKNGERQNFLNGDQLIAKANQTNASEIEIEEEKIDTNVAIDYFEYFHNLVMQVPSVSGIQPLEYRVLSKTINKEKAIFEYDIFAAEQLDNVQPAVLDHQRKVIHCNQKLFQRNQPDGSSKLMWVILDLHNGFDCSYQLTSPTFILADESCFQLTYMPAIKDNYSSDIFSQLILEGVPTKENQQIQYRFNVTYSSFTRIDGSALSLKHWQQTNQFLNGPEDKNILTKFSCFVDKKEMRAKLNLDRMFCIGISIEPLIYVNAKEEEEKQQQIQQSQTTQTKINRRIRSKLREHAYNGLVNEGTTCYLNSLIQTLFIIRAFRRAVYHMPTKMDDFKSIPYCLQRIFYNLQTGKNPVRTYELLNAFGWSAEEMNQQHDVNEFFLVLSDTLENQMKNTPVSGTYSQLFEGELENVVKCKNVNFESIRSEKFNCLQLSMTDATSVEEAIENYCKAEELVDENQYDAGKFGKQDADKFIRFKKLPPVLQVQINRFSYDIHQDQMTKINLKLKFQEILDLDSLLDRERVASQNLYSQPNVKGKLSQNSGVKNLYHLHSILIHRGGLGAGHYFAFIRPSLEDKWFEFNDSIVDPILRSTALAIGSGGPASYFDYNKNLGAVFERERPTNTSAYMLVYVRDADRPEIMREIQIEDIPRQLKVKFDEENKLNDHIDEDFKDHEDCSTAYITSYETIKDWASIDIMQAPGDYYQDINFIDNERQRLKVKLPKKATIDQLLNIIQLNTRIPVQDLILYRIRRKQDRYSFFQILDEDLKKPVFLQKIKPFFFVSSLSKPMGRPILKVFSEQEKTERVRHFKRVIDFVKRRGLSSDYVKFYKDQFSQVWRFSEQNILKLKTEESDDEEESDLEEVKSRLDLSSNIQTVMQSPMAFKEYNQRESEDVKEDAQTVQKHQDVAMSCEEDEEERTLEIKQTVDLIGINNQQGSNQLARNVQRLQKQDAKILFIKTFENDDPNKPRLKILGQFVLHRDLTLRHFMELILFEKQLMPLLEDPQVQGVEKQYNLVLETQVSQNLQSRLNQQQMTIERERSLLRFKEIYDQNDKSLYYVRVICRQTDLDELILDSFVDGTSIILVPVNPPVPALREAYPEDGSYQQEILQALNNFMASESTTLWLRLQEVTEDNPNGIDLGKHFFNQEWTAHEIMDEIRSILMREEFGGRQIQEGYLQLQMCGGQDDTEERWVQKNEMNIQLGSFSEDYTITFKVNKFHIDELFDQVQAKVTIFKQNNLKGVTLTKLMSNRSTIGFLSLFFFKNEVLPRYVNQHFPGFSEDEERKHWQLLVVHKDNSIVVRHPLLKESVAEIVKECSKKSQTLRMQYFLDEDIEIFYGQNTSPVLICCQVFDQYNSRIGNSILLFVENWYTLDQIQDAVRNRVKMFKIQHPTRRNYKKREQPTLEFDDEESTYNSELHHSKDYVMHLQEPCIDEAKLMYLEFGTFGRRQINYSQLILKEIEPNEMTFQLSEFNSRPYIRYFGLSVDVIYEDDDRQRVANGGGGRGLRINAQSSFQSPSNPYDSDDQANGDQNIFDPTQKV